MAQHWTPRRRRLRLLHCRRLSARCARWWRQRRLECRATRRRRQNITRMSHGSSSSRRASQTVGVLRTEARGGLLDLTRARGHGGELRSGSITLLPQCLGMLSRTLFKLLKFGCDTIVSLLPAVHLILKLAFETRHCRHRARGELLRVHDASAVRRLSGRCRSISWRALLHLRHVQRAVAIEATIIEHANGLTTFQGV